MKSKDHYDYRRKLKSKSRDEESNNRVGKGTNKSFNTKRKKSNFTPKNGITKNKSISFHSPVINRSEKELNSRGNPPTKNKNNKTTSYEEELVDIEVKERKIVDKFKVWEVYFEEKNVKNVKKGKSLKLKKGIDFFID